MPDSFRPDHPENPEQQAAPGSSLEPADLAVRVLALLEPELEADGLDLLDVRVFRGGGRYQVRVYVDLPDGGITLDQCTRAARTVSMLMEDADPFPGAYVLEVSSPGIRRPLRKPEHFAAAVGQKVEIKSRQKEAPARLRGVLVEMDGDTLVVAPAGKAGRSEEEAEPEPLRIALGSVVEANLDPEFDAQAIINADRRRRKEERREERQARKKKGRKSRPKKGKDQ